MRIFRYEMPFRDNHATGLVAGRNSREARRLLCTIFRLRALPAGSDVFAVSATRNEVVIRYKCDV